MASSSQARRFSADFDRLERVLTDPNIGVSLRSDPMGISPERALVFVAAGSISNFSRAASDVGLEIVSEGEVDDKYEKPSSYDAETPDNAIPVLYATMPDESSLKSILKLWKAYQSGAKYPSGYAPWWAMFGTLMELRVWGPEDRLGKDAISAIESQLPYDDEEEAFLELEIWPTSSKERRNIWRAETSSRINSLAGRIVSTSSIEETGFIYEAILAGIPAGAIREMLESPSSEKNLGTLDGIQFILPQTIGQGFPSEDGDIDGGGVSTVSFDEDAPFRVALLDGTPWIQVSSATVELKAAISAAMASAGVFHPSVFLGLPFRSQATSFSHVWLA